MLYVSLDSAITLCRDCCIIGNWSLCIVCLPEDAVGGAGVLECVKGFPSVSLSTTENKFEVNVCIPQQTLNLSLLASIEQIHN